MLKKQLKIFYLFCLVFVFMMPSSWLLKGERKIPETWNLKVEINKIIGRSLEKRKIERLLNQDGTLAIVGEPGVGKTSLALNYARLKYRNYNIVWIISLTNDLKSQLLDLVVALDESKADIRSQLREVPLEQLMFIVKEKLRRTNKTWLLVLDDVRGRETLYNIIPETHGDHTKHVLITSNNTKICETTIPLGVFSTSDALDFLKIKLEKSYTKEALEDLAKFLEFHPFVLNLAVATLNNDQSLDIQGYKNLFSKVANGLFSRKNMLPIKNDSGEYDCTSLERSTAITLERIKTQDEQAYLLVCLLSMLAPSDISTAIIDQLTNEIGQDNPLSPPISLLVQQSILKKYDNQGKITYSMHKILRKV